MSTYLYEYIGGIFGLVYIHILITIVVLVAALKYGYWKLICVESKGWKRLIILLHIYMGFVAYLSWFDAGLISGTLKCSLFEIFFMFFARICSWVKDGFKK